MKSLAPFRNQLNVLSGLGQPMAESMGDGAGDHGRSASSWLSGVHPKKTEGIDVRAGMTIDQIIAKEFGQHTKLPSLEVSLDAPDRVGNCEAGYSCTYLNTISWRTPTTPLPMEPNPRVVFERLFGEGDTAAERLTEAGRDRSILDWVTGEVSTFRKVLGASDQGRVTEYLDSVRDIERRIQIAEAQNATSDRALPEAPIGIPETFEEHCKLMFDLQALAYQADITRVSTFLYSYETNTRTYPQIGVPDAHHTLSHHEHDPKKIEKLIKINTYHVQMLAYFLEKLRSIPDGDGNLLDHSLIMYGGCMGDGQVHSHFPLACLLAGGAGGQLEGGRHLVYPLRTSMTKLLLNLVDLMNVPPENLTDATGVNEPLNRLTDL
jgi:hypothetical protein